MPNRVREGYWPLLLVINSDHLQWPLLARCHINNISLYPFKWAIGVDRAWWRGNGRKGSMPCHGGHAFRKSFAYCLMPLHRKRRPNCLTKLFKPTTLQTPDGDKWISRSRSIASSFEIKRDVPLFPKPLSPECCTHKMLCSCLGSFGGLHLGFVVFAFQNNPFRYLVKSTCNTCHLFGHRGIFDLSR